MDFNLFTDYMKGLFGKDKWIYQLIFCLIAPSYLIIYYISDNLFIKTDLLKLLILCVIINVVIFMFLALPGILLEYDKEKDLQNKLVKEKNEQMNSLTERGYAVNEEIALTHNQKSVDISERMRTAEDMNITIINHVFFSEIVICSVICIQKSYNIICSIIPSSEDKILCILLILSSPYIIYLLKKHSWWSILIVILAIVFFIIVRLFINT